MPSFEERPRLCIAERPFLFFATPPSPSAGSSFHRATSSYHNKLAGNALEVPLRRVALGEQSRAHDLDGVHERVHLDRCPGLVVVAAQRVGNRIPVCRFHDWRIRDAPSRCAMASISPSNRGYHECSETLPTPAFRGADPCRKFGFAETPVGKKMLPCERASVAFEQHPNRLQRLYKSLGVGIYGH